MPTTPVQTSDAALEAQVFWLRYRKEVAAILILALLIVTGFAAWKLYQERRATASSEALAGAKTAADYQAVIDHYGDTPAAASAYLLLADEQRKNGKLAEANATLQRFIDKFQRHELASTARMSVAANLEVMGKEDEAMAAYQQIVSTYPGSFNAPGALLAQARILQTKGRADDARRICETLITQYRQSYAAMEASQLLATMKPAATPTLSANAPIASPSSSTTAAPSPNTSPPPPSPGSSPTP
jgi:predicted negative regulator of RcsB-dependent stress response